MTEQEAIKQYNEMLNEMKVENLNLPMTTAGILKECDPIQYDCGFADFCNAEGIELED